MPKTIYDEVSTVTTYVKRDGKGKKQTKTQRVHFKNGKGFKEVSYNESGGKTRHSRKTLTKSEMKCLRQCKFKPFLFRECNEECLKQ
jgi:uncharacterized protein YxeA